MSAQNTGVSRRAYARSRKISEATVRKYLADGKLADAVLSDGTLDPEKADRLLASSITRGNNQPVALSVAKVRRLRAQVRSLDDKVRDLRDTSVLPDVAEDVVGKGDRFVASYLRPMAEKIAPVVVGMEAQAASIALRDAIHAALEAISSGFLSRPVSEPKKTELDLDGLSESQLMAMRINLDAEKLEYERAVAKGQLRVLYDISDEVEEKDQIVKSRLLAIPGRLAAQMQHATVEQARELIAAEIEQILALLTKSP